MSKTGYIADELADRVARICERTLSEVLELLQSQPAEKAVVLMPDWMSAVQLAQYWQLYNDKNEPTTAGILKWSKRAAGNENYDRALLPPSFSSGRPSQQELLQLLGYLTAILPATPIPYGDRKKSQGNDVGRSQL